MSEFESLVEQEIPRLRGYARALTRNAERADDLVQDTLVRAISKRHLWQMGTDPRAWLSTIMRNQHVNLCATSRPLISTSFRLRWSPATIPRHRANCANSDVHSDVCLRTSAVILLAELEGMLYEAAAQILDVPVGTVRSRLHAAGTSSGACSICQQKPCAA